MYIKVKELKLLLFYFLTFTLLSGCKKYLEEKSDQSLIVPESAADLQAILEDWSLVNQRDVGAGEVSSDDYYLLDNDYSGLNEYLRRTYVWEGNNLFEPAFNEWVSMYNIIYKANVVIFYADKLMEKSSDIKALERIKGWALFLRAKSYLQIATVWCLAYDNQSASTTLGLPLRLSPDFNIPSRRSSLFETYNQIIADGKLASELLLSTSNNVLTPTKAAAYALLGRTYLAMGDYDNCLYYSDLCLSMRNELLDYNLLNPNAPFPFPTQYSTSNPEDLYNSNIYGPPRPLAQSRCRIDSNLYRMFDNNDLRKKVFFRNNTDGSVSFKGSYFGSTILYSGFSLNEVYLMKAEANARKNNTTESLGALNELLVKRWITGTFIPYTAPTSQDALRLILTERRKELLMRGLRWMDIKRLNRDGENITLKRIIGNTIYTLPPNDKKYALPIPDDVISLTGMPQN